MAKGRRANLERLLRSAWERQTTLRESRIPELKDTISSASAKHGTKPVDRWFAFAIVSMEVSYGEEREILSEAEGFATLS
jgi:hypothetical protein